MSLRNLRPTGRHSGGLPPMADPALMQPPIPSRAHMPIITMHRPHAAQHTSDRAGPTHPLTHTKAPADTAPHPGRGSQPTPDPGKNEKRVLSHRRVASEGKEIIRYRHAWCIWPALSSTELR